MRFLLFNIASAGALAYLLWGQAGTVDLAGAATKFREAGAAALREIEQAAPRALEPTAADAIAKPAAAPMPPAVAEPPPASRPSPPAPTVPAKGPTEIAAAAAPAPDPLPIREIPMRPVPKEAPSGASPVRAGGLPALPPVEDPAVARRRDEVLGRAGESRPPAVVRTQIRKADGTEFMSPSERRRELQRLAEEMELLYADKVHR